jgi:hypothetical protein
VATRDNAVGHTTKKGKPCQNDGRGYSGSARRRQFESVDEDRPRTQCDGKSPMTYGAELVEVRGFEPRTPCMPSTILTFPDVRSCPNLLAITVILSADVS